MNDKNETMDSLRKYGITKGEEKAGELYDDLKKWTFHNLYEKIANRYQINSNDFDYEYYVGHVNYLKKEIERGFIETINKNKKNRKLGSKKCKYYKPENWIAKFAAEASITHNHKFCIGTIFDYEIPTGGVRKKNIDLLSYDEKEKSVRMIELKKENSNEYFKAIIELLDYYIRAKGYDLKKCDLNNHPYLKNKIVKEIKMTILTHSNSAIVRYYNNEKYQNIRKLQDLFKIELYAYTTKKHNTIKEEIIIDSIKKLK
ncbi:MAG: hypothetical protein J6P02_01100 [Lachnospiraceae bacterium]|nr:hypothetical protein [Lachnospiraceae bacterium]